MTELQWLDIFGDNLISFLEDARMSQRELADALDVSESTISSYIHKRKMPSLKIITKLAYIFDCSTDELIDFGEPID